MFRRVARPNYRSSVAVAPAAYHLASRRWAVAAVLSLSFLVLLGRFFYLQIVQGKYYAAVSRQEVVSFSGKRGRIFTSDNFLLVGNHYTYTVYVAVNKMDDPAALYDQVAPLIALDVEASASLRDRETFLANVASVQEKLDGKGNLFLADKVSSETMETLESLEIKALEPEAELTRFYPEHDLAGQVLGYLSRDQYRGRYGIEGGRDKELESKTRQSLQAVDAASKPLDLSVDFVADNLDGRDLYLTIRRDLQAKLEEVLATDLVRFGASRGEIIIMEPATGKILALATKPGYEPANYTKVTDISIFKNPAVVDLYEPGSTFKVITMAAAIDAGLVNPDTKCPSCGGPRVVAGHAIKTWNQVYHPGITMREALEESDNTAMVYVSDLLGAARMQSYFQAFGIGQPLELEVEEEVTPSFPSVWGPLEIANRAFGQGVNVTSLQLMRAVGAIANGGVMMKPYLVEKSDDHLGGVYVTEPVVLGQVISPETARTMASMMQTAAQHGEAKYLFKETEKIAGKTGSAQIPDPPNGYIEDTIASFIGFAPYDEPKFMMLVKYERPQSSPYAAETAAVTWMELADYLFTVFGIS